MVDVHEFWHEHSSINCFVPFCSYRATMWKEPKIEHGLKEVPLANWPMVDIKKQDTMFFAIVRKLKAFGLDPKYDLENKHVIVEECWFCLGDLGNSQWSPLAWSWKTRWVWRRFIGGSLGQHMLQIMKWMLGLCEVSLLNKGHWYQLG